MKRILFVVALLALALTPVLAQAETMYGKWNDPRRFAVGARAQYEWNSRLGDTSAPPLTFEHELALGAILDYSAGKRVQFSAATLFGTDNKQFRSYVGGTLILFKGKATGE